LDDTLDALQSGLFPEDWDSSNGTLDPLLLAFIRLEDSPSKSRLCLTSDEGENLVLFIHKSGSVYENLQSLVRQRQTHIQDLIEQHQSDCQNLDFGLQAASQGLFGTAYTHFYQISGYFPDIDLSGLQDSLRDYEQAIGLLADCEQQLRSLISESNGNMGYLKPHESFLLSIPAKVSEATQLADPFANHNFEPNFSNPKVYCEENTRIYIPRINAFKAKQAITICIVSISILLVVSFLYLAGKARQVEIVRQAEVARLAAEAETARQAEVARLAAEAEAARQAEVARLAAEAEAARQAETARQAAETLRIDKLMEGKAPFTIQGIGIEMLPVRPGEFLMGSPSSEKDRASDELQHRVKLTQPFWFGKYEVTQGQWEAVMRNNPSHFKGEDLPVERVSWEDAMEFCRKLNQLDGNRPRGYVYSLPTEAQWEYVCRAGTTTATAFGNSLSSREANFNGNFPYGGAAKGPDLNKTAPVGSYRPNAWGFYDLHGNVWEWCADWRGEYPSGSEADPPGPSTGSNRVLRGGGWFSYGRYCRSAYRLWDDPGNRHGTLGFRPSLGVE
jgi:formylglycine-generating enzyme required for sulfatase activity